MATLAPIPIYSRQQTFYVPHFEIRVDGQELKSNVIDDVLQLTYKDSVNDIDSFSIEINNWDAERRTFKFCPPQKQFAGIFDPGAHVEILMGYQGSLRRMMRGTVTSLEPSFSESAAPTLSIGGLNELYELRTEKHTKSWLDQKKTDSQIAKELCDLPVKKGQAGLGIGIETRPSPDETPEAFVYMNSQYDIVFLLERARRRGYEIYIKERDKQGRPTLYFGLAAQSAGAPVYRLEWGRSLRQFKPRLTTARQVSTVEVRGWDRKANAEISEKFTLEDLWKAQKKSQAEINRLKEIAKAYGDKTDVVTDRPVHTKKEAKELARSVLEDRSRRLVEASATCVGLPDLRAGVMVEIVGFGAHTGSDGQLSGEGSDFDGEYFVTETSHSIGANGYQTEFSARKQNALPKTQTARSGS